MRPVRYSTSRPETSRSETPSPAGLAARAPSGPASDSSSSLQRTHRTAWSGTAISSSGTAARQRSCSNPHRGANAQPDGHSPTPTATPGIPWSARGRRKSGIAPTSAARVRVPRLADHLVDRPVLDHPAGVHDHDPVGHAGDDGEVVRHVHHRHPLLAPQARQLGQDAVLGEDVEPGGRLVEHGDRRPADARHRDGHALLLPARQLVRVAAAETGIRAQLDPLERRAHGVVGGGLRPVRAQHIHDGVTDPEGGVEGAARILRDVRDDPAPQAPHRAGVAPDHLLSADLDRAAPRDDAVAGVAEERKRRGRLAAPGLADEPQDLARLHREADVLDDRLARGEAQAEVLDPDHGLAAVGAHAGTVVVARRPCRRGCRASRG